VDKFLYWLTGYLPLRIIKEGDAPYLERSYLFTLFNWRFYIHRFVASDPDRGIHDHPWRKAYSIILSGWYYEETRSGTHKVKWFNSLTGDTFHRVILPYSNVIISIDGSAKLKHCWTLFFHHVGDDKDWGFMNKVEDAEVPGTMIYVPYSYPVGFIKHGWWKTAKKGKELRKCL